jgi:hypothetical protein
MAKSCFVNSKKVRTFDLDNDQSIISRIASDYNTLPKYLYFPNGFKPGGNNVMEDILDLIKKDSQTSMDFTKFLEKVKSKLNANIRIREDVLYVWLAYNEGYERLASLGETYLQSTAESLVIEEYFKDIDEFERFWRTIDSIKKGLENKIETQQYENKKTIELYETFQKIESGLGYTELNIKRVSIQFNLNIKDITLLEIFNQIVTGEPYPFVTCKNYYKILKDYIPPEEWTPSLENVLILKVASKNVVDVAKFKEYNDVFVKVEGTTSEQKVVVNTKLITERSYLNTVSFIDRFIGCFTGIENITYSQLNETEVVGVFYFPIERINTYVFSDLVMNNLLFSSLINIDESNKTTKRKTDNASPWIHIHFNHTSTGRISASISQKVVDRAEPEMRETDSEIFRHGDPYIRISAKGTDNKSIQVFQEMFSKLLVIYNDNYNEIVSIYREFIPDFGDVEEILPPDRKAKPEMIAPDIFVKNYTRNCTDARMPKIIHEKKLEKYKSKGIDIMPFPREVQEFEPHFPSDGRAQKYIMCPNPDYPYPGIQTNKLSNADDYPFVPCCFKNPQDKKGGLYRHYFYNEPIETREKKQQEMITTDKFLSCNQFGMLPQDLEKLFRIIDNDMEYQYIRIGVDRSYSSFLNSVMLSLSDDTNILEFTTEEERKKELARVRKELSKIGAVAKQCAYDIPLKELMKEIANSEVYFDPKKYIQLLEYYYNCNIYLFNREQLMLPNFLQSYYKIKNDKRCIFIYEHMGSESDHARYPQCELMIKWRRKISDSTEYNFQFDSPVAKNVNHIFKLLRESYALNKKIQETVFPIPENLGILSQNIDSYGKTRQINIMFENEEISLLTSPIPPLPLKVSSKINYTTLEKAMKLVKYFNTVITTQTVHSYYVKEISCLVGNVNVTIPLLRKDKEIEGIPLNNTGLHYPEVIEKFSSGEYKSAIDVYNNNKKIARYITEYVFWLFSKYLVKNKIDTITDSVLNNFAQKYITVIPNFKYEYIAKTFSTKGGPMKEKKLVVTSEDMLKRLMYVLKLYSIRDLPNLLTYHERNVITHYYLDITDFDYYPNQVILYGDDAIDKWIEENRLTYNLHTYIDIGRRLPYFIKNKSIDNKVYLAQNVDTLEKAISVCITWGKEGYNPGYNPSLEESDNYAFTLYMYKNENDIGIRKIDGKKLTFEMKILGYKVSGRPYYTCLLDLD